MPSRFRSLLTSTRRGLPAILSVAAALAAWEVYVFVSGISALVLPSPSRVIGQIAANRELLWVNTRPTLQATLTGFSFSLTVAFTLSVLIDFVPRLRRALFPVFVISQTLPLVAMAQADPRSDTLLTEAPVEPRSWLHNNPDRLGGLQLQLGGYAEAVVDDRIMIPPV